MYKIKKDAYRKARGGSSRVLDVCCEHCGQHLTYYKKDGPGILKRMYVDRFIDNVPQEKELTCQNCQHILGKKIIYEKEKREAYRLFVGAVTKKIIKLSDIN